MKISTKVLNRLKAFAGLSGAACLVIILSIVSHQVSAESATATMTSSEVTHVKSTSANTNFGNATPAWATDSTFRTFIRFKPGASIPAGANITSATLRVYVTNLSVTTGSFDVRTLPDTWAENTATWNNKPTWSTSTIGTSARPAAVPGWVEIALPASAVSGSGNTSLGLRYTAPNSQARIATDDDTTVPSRAPQLVVNYDLQAPPEPPEPTPGQVVMAPTKDAYTDSSKPSTNYGTANPLRATDSTYKTFLSFDTTGQVPAGTEVTSAKLKLFIKNIAVNTGGFKVYPAGNFIESGTGGLTNKNRPPFNNLLLSVSRTPVDEQYITIDLPMQHINQNGIVNLEIRYSASNSQVQFGSRTGPVAERPQLVFDIDQHTAAPAAGSVRVNVAGDIACIPSARPGSMSNCLQGFTSDLVIRDNPSAVLTLGDIQYDAATTAELASFDASWGRFKNKIYPASGNHEYKDHSSSNSALPAQGYYDYFNGTGVQTGRGGDRTVGGYYSFDLNGWHIIALDSECTINLGASPQVWGVPGGCAEGSPQYTWLQNDLATHTNECTLAMWHQPRFTAGEHSSQTKMGAMWNLMVNGGVDVTLNGHNHSYEEFKPIGLTPANSILPTLDPNGIKSFVVGTGGVEHSVIGTGTTGAPLRASDNTTATLAQNDSTYGVMRLDLGNGSYTWEMVPVPGQTFVNKNSQTTGAFSGAGSCH